MSNQTDKRPRGRPPKFPPAEVKARLVDSGLTALREHGLEVGLDAVNLDHAIAISRVPRGMAYRIWQDTEGSPQEALRSEVVLALLGLPATTGIEATRELLGPALNDMAPMLESDDEGQRFEAMSELIRTVGAFNHEQLDQSEEWRLYNALRSSVLTRKEGVDPEVLALLEKGEDRLIEEYAALFGELADVVGLSLREGFTMKDFSAAAYALNEGLSARLSTSYRREGHRAYG